MQYLYILQKNPRELKPKEKDIIKLLIESKDHHEKLGNERRSKIGTGDRSEKIRTYNYPQNRVTDHRINLTLMQLDRIMQGKMDELIESLINEDIKRKLAGE